MPRNRPQAACPRCSRIRNIQFGQPKDQTCRDCRATEPTWPIQQVDLPGSTLNGSVENPPPCTAADPKLFDSIDWETHETAKAFCRVCPDVAGCLKIAQSLTRNTAPDGTWGGVLWINGKIMLRQPRRPLCGTENGHSWHRNHGQESCPPCHEAHKSAVRRREADRRRKARSRAAQTEEGAA